MADLIAITGASGTVGGLVAAQLSAGGAHLRLIGRDSARLPSLPGGEVAQASGYDDTAAMTAALTGASAMLLVSGRESANRVAEHRSAVDAAVAAGVHRIVYTSFYGARAGCTFTFGRDHWHTEQYIRESGLGFTFLRDNFYLGILPALAGSDGVIRGPGGSGSLAAVAQRDIAAVAATVLAAGAEHDGASYDLTGPQALGLEEIARVLTSVSGRTVRYVEETVDEAYESRAVYGAPAFEVDGWVSTYVAIARGELDQVSPDIERLLGRPPQAFADFLAANPSSFSHLL
ncbi:MAG: NAD(P)-dependent oxidoreductase [Pseudonocardiales bacterium]|nr:NAD(P)-dependent oxidoreductase [Pseudonocardiales bacterium]